MNYLLDYPDAQFRQWLTRQDQPSFRLDQIRRWVFQKRAQSFDQMTDLPLDLRRRLREDFRLWSSSVVRHRRAADGTEKLLLELADGSRIECVLLRDGRRRSICISSQVGCAMGCVFCASGLDGLERNLTAGEMLEQMLRLQQLLPPQERLSHIVVMGMGEPLANLDRVLAALDQARSADGLGISARRITISTVGLPAAMRRLAEHRPHYELAVSLHAPSDQLRRQLLPAAARVPLRELLAAADHYFAVSGRRLTFEYVLLAGLNDQPQHARQLARLLRGRTALLNVIPYNRVPGLPLEAPDRRVAARFRQILESAGVAVQFRQRKGNQIDAACGQLRRLDRQAALQ